MQASSSSYTEDNSFHLHHTPAHCRDVHETFSAETETRPERYWSETETLLVLETVSRPRPRPCTEDNSALASHTSTLPRRRPLLTHRVRRSICAVVHPSEHSAPTTHSLATYSTLQSLVFTRWHHDETNDTSTVQLGTSDMFIN